MDMRIRLPELLDEYETTAYAIAEKSGGRIDPSTLYRLTRQQGRVKRLDTELLEALYQVLGLTSLEELLEIAPVKRGRG